MTEEPIAKKAPVKITHHNHTRIDDYHWMGDRDNPETIQYLNRENEYLALCMRHTEALQQKLFEEMKGRIKEDDVSVPYFLNGYFYYHKFEPKKEFPIYCRKKGNLSEQENTLLDVNQLAEGQEYTDVNVLKVSENGQILAYSEDHIGRRIYTIFFKDLETGKPLDDRLTKVTGNCVWANDNNTLFYTQQDPVTLRPNKIFRHKLGDNQQDDELIYEETDPTFHLSLKKSKSRDFIFLISKHTLSTEYRFLPANTPYLNPVILQERQRDLEYEVEHDGESFIILTNADGAKNFKLVKCPLEQTKIENWEEIIPHREHVLLEEFEVFQHHLVINERFNGLSRLEIRSWDGQKKHVISMDEPAYTVWLSHNPEFYTDILRFGYNSLTTPSSIYDYHMDTKEKSLMKRQEVVGGYDPELYQTERLWAKSEDGTEIPISLVYKKELFSKTGGNPLLLYAYGSYGFSTEPTFSSHRLSLLDRGFVFAIAHVRGGQEMGRLWYEYGKMLKKKNTFLDFIACAEYLIKEAYTAPQKIFAMGGSAGGLLMGAVINMRPDLFYGVVAAVPFVDVVTTMLDESIPLTTSEFDEWGNPKHKTYYDYMLSYSPYDNVGRKSYPHLLVTSGLHDSQVQFWEPTKWVAKLRDYRTNQNLLLLYTNMGAGHGGASGRYKALKELALEYAFLLDLAKKQHELF
ncbi:S9 family peptidase [Negadavirga shengliensis]|uniref:S9 family peptidase n=1 Tax=Negadavirga shengliensis TaxID=1389218 RepID=A0ABV9SYI7_9BACT